MEALKTSLQKIKRLAIANRGEVAVRIIHACQELGVETLLLHSEVDVQSRAFRMADFKYCIGPAASSESYLNIAANVQGAKAGGAQAVHPGFGFLSENSEFVNACDQAGLIFVGPSAQSMSQLGDKVLCKELALKLGVPLVPGYQGDKATTDKLYAEAQKIGFPVIVKAAAGGGGRGMKLLSAQDTPDGHKELIDSARREALAAFGSEKVFLEKYLDHAKHIEFQIFVDATGQVFSLLDRECSVQRRHQKIIEEALSPSLTPSLREQMSECAKKIVGATGYRGAATVEFLLQDGEFYLLEVNTRLQVEHPVTEMVTGIDLVKAQILTADGQKLSNWSSAPIRAWGHSIECRVYAEDPYKNGIPSIGKLGLVRWPEGPGRRFEYGFSEGDTITSFYDPMIAKVIVYDENRPRAIQKMKQVLRESILFGVQTNIPYLLEILSHPEFMQGVMTTRFIDQHFTDKEFKLNLTAAEKNFLKQVGNNVHRPGADPSHTELVSPFTATWSTRGQAL
jgi:3-methylcrotonyl-CoA carboxylase alpha subunit